MLSGDFHKSVNPSTHQPVQQFDLNDGHQVLVARDRSKLQEQVALRLRVGRTGYSQWLNELYVYLLPRFEHVNILPLLGYDKRLLSEKQAQFFNSKHMANFRDSKESEDDDDDNISKGSGRIEQYDISRRVSSSDGSVPVGTDEQRPSSDRKLTIEYWLVNTFSGCITLRHYLLMHTLGWKEMVNIAHGIMCGVHFLHDNAEYTFNLPTDITRSVDGYIRSTKGALKKACFKDNAGVLHLKPPLAITIIHRNLSSLNVVIGPDFVPRIWNFGFAYVYHPFQPLNFDHFVDAPIKSVHMSSPYSPPEVLSERTYFTYQALKSHDLYSCGMLLYEMLSRCVLPPVEGAPAQINLERADPMPYAEPFAREFNYPVGKLKRDMLHVAVCRYRTRPSFRSCWMTGRKSARFVQLIRDLWDQDYEARLHSCTAIGRLERAHTRIPDKPNKFPMSNDREFNIDTMWPPEEDCHQAPRGAVAKDENLVYESLVDLRAPTTSPKPKLSGRRKRRDRMRHDLVDSTTTEF